MFKLISLEGFLNLSADTFKKIEEVLTSLGLDKTEKYDDIDEFLDAVVYNIDAGDTVAVTTENEEYNSVKKQLLRTFSLKKESSQEIQNKILTSRSGIVAVNDLEGHCLVPSEGDVYITQDGLYSAFCVEFSNGARLIYFPLDEGRFEDIKGYIENEMNPKRDPDYEDEYFDDDEDNDDKDEAFVSGIFAAMVAEEEARKKAEHPEYDDAETDSILSSAIRDLSGDSEEDDSLNENGENTTEETGKISEYSETDSFVDSILFSGSDESDRAPEKIFENESYADYYKKSFGLEDTTDKAEKTPVREEENKPEENAEDEEKKAKIQLKNGEEIIIDDNADEADLTGFEEALSAAEKAIEALLRINKKVAYVGAETSPFVLAMGNEIEDLSTCFKVCDVKLENEDSLETQVAMAKKARLAIEQEGADYAASVSPVVATEKDGKEFYYSYIVIHDGTSAKAKKVSTTTRQGVESLVPHAFAVMFGLIERNAINVAQLESDDIAELPEDKRKKTMTLALCIAAAVLAISSAVIMVWSYFGRTPEILITTNPYETTQTNPVVPSSSTPSITLSDNTSVPVTDPGFNYPGEPTAGDVSNVPTSTPFSSTKGTFTFTVYGYGHGVGMSQTGADYYGDMGKSYLEILAIYYYGATLVLGDTTPATVKFGGTDFTLRDYLATAVESEMGGKYNPEALKAQAAAVYTFAKYYNFDVPNTLHAFNKKPSKASYAAVDVVMGQYMIYNGEVIKPYFHATSAGKTAAYTNVFGEDHLPYLAGGRPSYGDVNAKNYCTTVTYTSDELNALIYSKTGVSLSGDPANWIKILSHDSCINQDIGYISKIQVGDQIYTGYDFRMKVLGGALRSHCFTFIYTPTA